MFFFFSSRRRHTRCGRDWSSDVCSSDLDLTEQPCNPHCEELVEVRGEDRTKLDALEQRQPLIRSELEHPLVEIQPRELTVDSLRSNELELRTNCAYSHIEQWCNRTVRYRL